MPLTPGHRRFIGALLALAVVVIAYEAAAQRGAGRVGGAAAVSRSGSAQVHRGAYGGNYHASSSVSRTSVNGHATRNVNVNRNINVDVDHGYYRPGAGLAVAGAVAVTAAAIGSVAYSIPSSCVAVVRAGVTYQQCGSTWYQPQYAGTSMNYVVVAPPG
jgi:hypothetical protein